MTCPERGRRRNRLEKRWSAGAKMNWLVKIVRSLRSGIADLSPDCKTATRLQSEALDRELPLRRRFGLRVHRSLCKWCRRYGKQIDFLRKAAHEHPDQTAEPVRQRLSDQARERIKQSLRANQE